MKGMISVRRRRAARWTGEGDHGQGRGFEGGGCYSSYGDGRGVQNGRVSSCERPSTGFMRRRGPYWLRHARPWHEHQLAAAEAMKGVVSESKLLG